MGHPRVVIMVVTYHGGFVLVRIKFVAHSQTTSFTLLKLLYGTLFHKYSHGSKNNSVPS